ncbi:MAG: nucleolar complex protein 14 [Watsoniomyces obsoletus]|nr:MAG: nucleolar complex protein 14 [Watsoniomyces obsoletus]
MAARVPPNLKFEIDDAEAEWAYTGKFDFIHLRTMGGSIKDVPRLLRQAHHNLKPGGWIEWQEYQTTSRTDDNSFPKDSAMLEWTKNLNDAAVKFGKVMNVAPLVKGYIQDAGFVNVKETIRKVPMSPWAKDPKLKQQGRYNQLATLDSLQAYSLRLFTTVLGWPAVRAEMLIANVRKELMDPSVHMYSTL